MKKFSVFLLFFSALLLHPPSAKGASLESWRFDANQNQLEFTTDEGVQPQAQLVADPTRLVIDLPGIMFGRPRLNEALGGVVRSIRIGQFDRQTTRLVIELAPGYTLDPNQIKFRGITARQWVVKLPTPQRLPDASPESTIDPTVNFSTGSPAPLVIGSSVAAASAPVSSGSNGSFPGASMSPSTPSALPLQTVPSFPGRASSTPPSQSSLGSGVSQNTSSQDASQLSAPEAPPQTATIESVELDSGGNQLLIRANHPLQYMTRWERSLGAYRIDISPAELGRHAKSPSLGAGSAIAQLWVRQETPQTVSITVKPSVGARIGQLSQPTERFLTLQIQRSRPVQLSPLVKGPRQNSPTTVVNPTLSPGPRITSPTHSLPANFGATPNPQPLRMPNGRPVVIVDPGHGGPDPGSVGIGGLQEKGIVLDIGNQVALLLQRYGVQAFVTRNDDRDLDLEPRVQMAEQSQAAVFVSIHANAISLSRPDVSGLETYYYQSGQELAQTIHQSILQTTGIADRGVRTARFYVLRKTSMPSVLVEVGFVTGQDDAMRLSNPAYRSQMADAIARGILQYLQKTARL